MKILGPSRDGHWVADEVSAVLKGDEEEDENDPESDGQRMFYSQATTLKPWVLNLVLVNICKFDNALSHVLVECRNYTTSSVQTSPPKGTWLCFKIMQIYHRLQLDSTFTYIKRSFICLWYLVALTLFSSLDHMYFFEGKDYTKDPDSEDQKCFDRLLEELQTAVGEGRALRHKDAVRFLSSSLTSYGNFLQFSFLQYLYH